MSYVPKLDFWTYTNLSKVLTNNHSLKHQAILYNLNNQYECGLLKQ